jgi:hypothetical protein
LPLLLQERVRPLELLTREGFRCVLAALLFSKLLMLTRCCLQLAAQHMQADSRRSARMHEVTAKVKISTAVVWQVHGCLVAGQHS